MDSPKTPDALASMVAGPVLYPGSAGYAEECATYNLAVTHRPAVVVGATCAADVSAALRYAADHDLPVGVLATGHQAIIPADGAVLITTRRMTGVRVDPVRRSVRVAAGERWQAVVDAAAEHGLAPLAGSSPLVGVIGYTLGGGLSPMLGRAYGWAADHVTAIDVVTADGVHHHTGPQAEADLFNAVLGGKSNLGVVTAIEFGLFPVARLYAGGLFFAGTDAAAVLRAYAKVAENAPDELTTSIALLRLPPLPGVPALLAGKFVVHVRWAYLGSAGEGAALAEPLRAAAPMLLDTVREMPFGSFAEIHSDPVDPAPFLERTEVLGSLPEDAVQRLLELAGPDGDCQVHFVELRHLGGALNRPAAHAAGHRDGQFVVWVVAVGMPAGLSAQNAFADELFARLAPWSTGRRYLNFMSTEDVEAAEAAYDSATVTRLRTAKHRYDPANLLRLNHNITPTENGHTMTDRLLRTLTDHAAITDAVHRYTAGLDRGDADLLASSLTEDAVVDLSPATAKIGFEFPALAPRQVVVDSLIPAVGPLDTSHAVSNVRIALDEDTATVQCYAMAQHFKPGDGPKPDQTRHALMMNRYDAELVRDGDDWRIRKLVIDNAWFEGDPGILLGQ